MISRGRFCAYQGSPTLLYKRDSNSVFDGFLSLVCTKPPKPTSLTHSIPHQIPKTDMQKHFVFHFIVILSSNYQLLHLVIEKLRNYEIPQKFFLIPCHFLIDPRSELGNSGKDSVALLCVAAAGSPADGSMQHPTAAGPSSTNEWSTTITMTTTDLCCSTMPSADHIWSYL